MKNTCKNLPFSIFTHISSLFQNFLFTVISAVLSNPNHSIKHTVSVIVSVLFQYILLLAFQVYKLFIITLQCVGLEVACLLDMSHA